MSNYENTCHHPRGILSTDSMCFSSERYRREHLDVDSSDSSNSTHHRSKLSANSMCFSNDCRRREPEEAELSNYSRVDSLGSPLKYNTPSYMVTESDRLFSFNKSHWLKYIVDPKALAAAGFFYVGIDDKAKCFRCGCIIGDWNFTDNPWEEHAFWSPDCKFVLQEKGPLFVASVKKRWGQHLKMLNFDKQTNDLIGH